ncbi:DUF1919 domain-containing protein [Flavobacterium zepuense]|uniref:DUF1919 domain-containing protein n=1 Tax=Flavobacterium zepuense TaxID=2593302 RepID=A0A552V7I0_9FLAO|nr:DUF1919 domain-containing protein [Flavobacterium zepuense]TRW26418.1 DUF1919 domain-containing protein [Flavobacterium zepuense]
MIRKLVLLREQLGTKYSLKKIKNKDFTIISDNCWGGNLYTQLKISYKTPTVGLGMGKHGYLNFIEKLNTQEATTFWQLSADRCYPLNPRRIYPVGKTSLGTVHFLHYKEFDPAVRLFQIRYKKINWDNIFYKIDFELEFYTPEHIQRWNDMKIPNSIAFYSDRVKKIWDGEIHNGVYINNWEAGSSYIFGNFQDTFNYIEWLNTGRITTSFGYRMLSVLFLNPTTPQKAIRSLKNTILKPLRVTRRGKAAAVSV